MLKQLKNKTDGRTISGLRQQGFTIIEVMIVLAIAGLIILVVLLAVPALQRNSRNTAIKNDASALAGGVTEYESNNDGAVPAVATQSGSSVTFCDAATCSSSVAPATAKVQSSTVVNYEVATSSTTTATSTNFDLGTVDVVFKAKCGASSGTTQNVTYSPRSTAVVYVAETSSSMNAKCIDS